MKKNLTKMAAMIMMIALVVSLAKVSAFADAALPQDDYQSANYDVVVAANDGSGYLYFRTGPGMNYDIICNIYDGTVLHINATTLDYSGEFSWGRIFYDGRNGWVSLAHVQNYNGGSSSQPSAPSTTSVSYDVAVQATDGTDYLYLRSGPSMDYEILETIYNGAHLHISAEQRDSSGTFTWGQTEYHGKTGWVSLLHVMDYNQYLAQHPTQAPATPAPTAAPTATPTAAPTQTATATPEITKEPEPAKTETPEATETPAAEETKEAEISETPSPDEQEDGETGIAGFLKDKFGDKDSGDSSADSEDKDADDSKDKKDKDTDEDSKDKDNDDSKDKKDKDADDEDEDDNKDKKSSSSAFDGKLLAVVLIAIAAVLVAIVVLLIVHGRKNKKNNRR